MGAPGSAKLTRAGRAALTSSATRTPRRAFTMVELLVVIFILGVLVTLVVSVSKYVMGKASREQTIADQKIILTAIEAFKDVTGEYPADRDPNGSDYNLEEHFEKSAELLRAQLLADTDYEITDPNIEQLFDKDDEVAAIRAKTFECLKELPEECFKEDDRVFRDAYGEPIAYKRSGGLGGRPVLISRGPDGRFVREQGRKDNIRSDRW